MKKRILILLVAAVCLFFTACSNQDTVEKVVPQASQMKSICELATVQCYYHNVAKYFEEDVSGMWLWKKDRNFWVEYSGIITIGIDTSLVAIEVEENNVTISIPQAKVLSCKVDDETLTEASFIVAKNSASVEAEHQTKAFKEAQEKMWAAASSDTALLANAQERAKKLIEDYVNNIGECTGTTYTIKWIYLDEEEDLSDPDENETVGANT